MTDDTYVIKPDPHDHADELLQGTPAHTKGRRIDPVIQDTASGETLWSDISGVHATAPSYLARTRAFALQEHLDDVISIKQGKDNPHKKQITPCLISRESEKVQKYAPLMRIASMQRARSIRRKAPVFFPCILSHSGELSSGTFRTVEWLAMKQSRNIAEAEPSNGIGPNKASAVIRRMTMDMLAASVARGFGTMLLSAGFPLGSKAKRKGHSLYY